MHEKRNACKRGRNGAFINLQTMILHTPALGFHAHACAQNTGVAASCTAS